MQNKKGFIIKYHSTISIICLLWISLISFSFAEGEVTRLNQAPTESEKEAGDAFVWTETRTSPRPLRIHYLLIKAASTKLELATSMAPDPDGDGIYETLLTMPETLLEQENLLAGINANAFQNPTNPNDHNWFLGKEIDALGAVVMDSVERSPDESDLAAFWVDDQRVPHIGLTPSEGDVLLATAGWRGNQGLLLLDGQDYSVPDGIHPRTAIGYDANKEWIIMVVVDGRQSGFSEGVDLDELVDIMQSAGCYNALNMDGGGSSIMMMKDTSDNIININSPSGGSSRPIPVLLGIREINPDEEEKEIIVIPPPSIHWKFDEKEGIVAFDSGTAGLNATNSNGTLVGNPGKYHHAFLFDGIDDVSATAATAEPQSSDLTITAWIRPAYISKDFPILSKEDSFSFKIKKRKTGDLTKVIFTIPNLLDHTVDVLLAQNEWQFIAVTFCPNKINGCSFYYNDSLAGTIDSVSRPINTNALTIGTNQWGQAFVGGIDDLRVYDHVLTKKELHSLYQKTLYTLWKDDQFTLEELADPLLSNDTADMDNDHLGTLIEYALGLDPTNHNGHLAGHTITQNTTDHWTIQFNHYATRTDIDLTLEWTHHLLPLDWKPIAKSTAGESFQLLNGANLVSETGQNPAIIIINTPNATSRNGFLRWKATRR